MGFNSGFKELNKL